MKTPNWTNIFISCVLVSACSSPEIYSPTGGDTSQAANALPSVDEAELADNPFRQDWQTPFGVPPFAEIEDDDYMPAFSKAIEELRSEISAITAITSEPTFENTILALELAGSPLDRVAYTFNNVSNTDSNDMLRELETQIFPLLTREFDAIVLNQALYERVKTVYDARDELDLDEQQARLLELTHRRFVRAGATFAPEVKERVAEINAEISGLNTQFAQNLLLETKGFTLELQEEDEVAGLSDDFKSAIYDADKKAWVVGLNRSAYESFMVQSTNRELRERLFNGYRLRASKGEYDNGPIAVKIAQLRAERAALMGYDSHAHYILEYNMAKTPQGAEDFLLRVWRPALAQAKQERADMQGMMGGTKFEAWDWWHQAEKLRLQRYALDENATKPYFKLENVQAGAHAMAGKLFGLSFEHVPVEGWNPLVVSFDVKDEAGEHLGLFMTDMFARDSKRGGAWMSSYRGTSNINGDRIRPLITNNMNLPQPPEGEPALMRYSDVETLFHEFGHALHGLMTQIDYPTFSGVDGPRDYTEFPAQILEHWVSQPEMLAMYAKHYQTGEVIPIELVEKIRVAANHNQGFKTTEYVAASLLDLAWHSLSVEEAQQITEARAFEREVLESYGLIDEIEPRYRSQYFSHIFAGGYSAGYYAYLWSEILDADGFTAFKQAEDIWDPELAGRLKRWVYEAGGLRPADELYRNFRGQDPSIEPLLEGRGFIDTPSPDA